MFHIDSQLVIKWHLASNSNVNTRRQLLHPIEDSLCHDTCRRLLIQKWLLVFEACVLIGVHGLAKADRLIVFHLVVVVMHCSQ